MADLWGGFEHDPRDPAYAAMRAGDRDRDLILGALGDAFADGRLTREEYDERSDQLTAARTLGELPVLVSDLLPATNLVPRAAAALSTPDLRQRAVQKFEKDRREALWGLISASAVCWVIWAISGGGYQWPLWVMLGTGLNVGRVLFQRQDIIDEEIGRLERKAEKARRKELEQKPDDGS